MFQSSLPWLGGKDCNTQSSWLFLPVHGKKTCQSSSVMDIFLTFEVHSSFLYSNRFTLVRVTVMFGGFFCLWIYFSWKKRLYLSQSKKCMRVPCRHDDVYTYLVSELWVMYPMSSSHQEKKNCFHVLFVGSLLSIPQICFISGFISSGSMYFIQNFKVHTKELDVKPHSVYCGLWNTLDKQLTAPIAVSFTPLTLQLS